VPHPRSFIACGALAGAVGGLLAFAFARIFAEPVIQQAIDYETGRDKAQAALDRVAGLTAGETEHEIFSRTLQGNLGIGVGIVAFGIAVGALVAVVYVVLLGRVGMLRPRTLALLVAGGGFLGVYLVPFLKYPANPPAIGHANTITIRGTLYLVMVAASIVLLIVAVAVARRLAARLGTWNAVLVGSAVFIVAIGVVMALLPARGELSANVAQYGHHATETPLPLTDASGTIVFPGFPADVLAEFRLYSVIAQAILWGVIGLIFSPLADRLLTPSRDERTDVVAA
jgi:Probable cobalt transporter subunit (CbtA)